MQNSMVMFTSSDFDCKYPIWVNLVQKVKIVSSLSLKFATETNLNMQNSMVMFTFSDLKLEYPFWVNLVQKIKIVPLSWNLVPRLIWICRIQRCGSFYLCYGWKYPFWANLVQKIEFVLLSQNLVPTLIRICRIQWYGSFNLL